MAGLILLAFWMSVQEKSSVTVMEEKWIVLLLFPRSQKHGKIRTITIMLFFTATVAVNILLLSILPAAERMGFRLSYSKKGCPFDNAPMESFHSILKKEEVYLKHYSSFLDANIRLFDYINGFYNRNRIHSAINFFVIPFNLKILYL